MAQIKINEKTFINGFCSISRGRDVEKPGSPIVTVGILSTHEYFPKINTIETERYYIVGVDVYQEDFGTNDYLIKYSFIADEIIIKDDYVPDECKVLIEDELFEEEDDELFHARNFEKGINEYYKKYGDMEVE